MGIIKNLSRLGAMLAILGVIAAAFASAASASTAMIPRPAFPGGYGSAGGAASPVTVVHTVVVGGMPGWQIAVDRDGPCRRGRRGGAALPGPSRAADGCCATPA